MTYEFLNKNLENAVKEIVENNEVICQDAQKLMAYIDQVMIRRKVKDFYRAKDMIDLLFASAHLYRIYYQDNKISTLFLLREKTRDIFDKHLIDRDTQDKIFQMCECHMGEDSLADFLIPQKGYPDDIFADAIFIMNLK